MPAELRSARSAAAVVVVSCLVTPSSAAILPGMGKLFDKATGGGSAGTVASAVVDSAPSWEALDAMLRKASTDEELAFRSELESGRGERASALATKRLFDLPDGQEPRLTLYRDTAAWCPYCEKVWLLLEEKRVPYAIEKVNMNCGASRRHEVAQRRETCEPLRPRGCALNFNAVAAAAASQSWASSRSYPLWSLRPGGMKSMLCRLGPRPSNASS